MSTHQSHHHPIDPVARLLEIQGEVQGVGYRMAMLVRAHELQLQGWVRNRRSGDVQALVQGPRQAVEAMQTWCHDGPTPARVISVRAEPQALDTRLDALFICRETVD